MEYLEQGALTDVLATRPGLPYATKLAFARDAAAGMGYIHSKKRLHRDLKSGLACAQTLTLVSSFELLHFVLSSCPCIVPAFRSFSFGLSCPSSAHELTLPYQQIFSWRPI